MAQPALGRQLANLQRELQVELFTAGAPRATLTAAGDAGVRLARDLIRDAELAVERARLSDSGLAGRVVLMGGPLAVLSGYLATFVGRMQARMPAIELSVIEGGGPFQWNALARASADIGIGVAPPATFASLAAELQYRDRVDHALMNPAHPLASREHVTLHELSAYPLFALEDVGSEPDKVKKLLVADRSAAAHAGGVREVGSVEALMAHVRAGHGWTFIPRRMAQRFPPLVAVPIDGFVVPYNTSRIWRRADARPVVRTVLAALADMQTELDGEGTPPIRPIADDERYAFRPARLELRHIRSFAEVAKRGSFGRAAETLHVTQPALSRQVRMLEQDVGVRLFERGTRGVELTAPGETFHHDVTMLLDDVERLVREVQRAQRGTKGRYVLGLAAHVHIDRIVSETLRRLASTDTQLISARSMTTPQLGDALRRSEIDIAIAYAYPMPVAQMDGLARESLFRDEMRCALLRKDHPLAERDSLSLAELQDVPFLFPRRTVLPRLYDAVMQQFSIAGVTPRVSPQFDGVLTIWTLTARGLGWSLGTAAQLEQPPPCTRCVPLLDFYLPWGGEVVYRHDDSRPAVRQIIDTIIDASKSLIPAQVDRATA